LKKIFFCISIFLATSAISSQIELWLRVSGEWDTVEISGISQLIDTKTRPYKYNYSELINNHTITSSDVILFDRMVVKARLESSKANDSAFAVFFNSPGDFRIFDAFIITGNEKAITTASLIKSSVIDAELPRNRKSNFSIETIASTSFEIPYGSDFIMEILIEPKRVVLLIDGKMILAQSQINTSTAGRLGFYHRNNVARLFDVKVYHKKKLILSDDFTANRIRKPTVNATIEKQSK
jgi:hypothetical protein